MNQETVAVIFGGLSGEHVVSLRSAASIMEAIDKDRYRVVPVGITRDGQWISGEGCWKQLWERSPQPECRPAALVIDPRQPGLLVQKEPSWEFIPLDMVFPVLHGPYGEDGTIQGLLELCGLPYVGCGVLASAVSMDKVIMKTLFKEHGLPVGPYLYMFSRHFAGHEGYWRQQVEQELGYPCFVKPANLGSSVGISRVEKAADLARAIREAFKYDHKVVVEGYISGREIECSVLGDSHPQASRPGEIIPGNLFYDYQAKYIQDNSRLIIPAELPPLLEQKVRDLAVKAFMAVEGSGLSRVDFFVRPEQNLVILNEINTMPGFTSISMYPKLWEASGIPFRELVNRLLDLARSRFQHRRGLVTAPPE